MTLGKPTHEARMEWLEELLPGKYAERVRLERERAGSNDSMTRGSAIGRASDSVLCGLREEDVQGLMLLLPSP